MNEVNITNDNKIPLCLPFIFDQVSHAIKDCFFQTQLQNDVVLVNMPQNSIKKQLVRNRLHDRI